MAPASPVSFPSRTVPDTTFPQKPPCHPPPAGGHRTSSVGRLGPRGWASGAAHRPPPAPQTQPVPNPMAYFLHHSPWWVHRFETLSNHFLELVVPFFIFLGRRMCVLHGALQIFFQVSHCGARGMWASLVSAQGKHC